MDRNILIDIIKEYDSPEAIENSFKTAFLELLTHTDAFQRHHLPGHITGSAWIVDHSGDFVLLTKHAKLNRWLQPGGHADGDENVLRVALREATEETGISDLQILTPGIFDIDIHTIPARKEMPEHQHYDIRFLLQADKQMPLLVTEESHALAWVPAISLSEITGGNESILRMVRKMKLL